MIEEELSYTTEDGKVKILTMPGCSDLRVYVLSPLEDGTPSWERLYPEVGGYIGSAVKELISKVQGAKE